MTRLTLDEMPNDPRSLVQKLGRADCRLILDKAGIKYHPGLTQIEGVKLIEANGIDPTQAIEWEQIPVKGADGQTKMNYAPKRTVPVRSPDHDAKALAEVDRLSALAIEEEKKTEKKVETLEDEISQLKALVTKLIEQKQEPMIVDEVSVVVAVDYMKMHWKKFQKLAKEIGIEWTTKDPRQPVIEKLEAQHG